MKLRNGFDNLYEVSPQVFHGFSRKSTYLDPVSNIDEHDAGGLQGGLNLHTHHACHIRICDLGLVQLCLAGFNNEPGGSSSYK